MNDVPHAGAHCGQSDLGGAVTHQNDGNAEALVQIRGHIEGVLKAICGIQYHHRGHGHIAHLRQEGLDVRREGFGSDRLDVWAPRLLNELDDSWITADDECGSHGQSPQQSLDGDRCHLAWQFGGLSEPNLAGFQ